MKTIVRAVALIVLAAVLQHCGGLHVQGCPDIPQRSSGPCEVGAPPDWYYDSSWRTQ